MKIYLLFVVAVGSMLLSCACSSNKIIVNEETFPDKVFREIVHNKYGDSISEKEIQSITYLDLEDKGIYDLTGIEHFTFLRELNCRNSTSEYLGFNSSEGEPKNQISKLDLRNNTALEELRCSNIELQSLNIDGCLDLELLWCSYNNLSSLNTSTNTALKHLEATNNALTKIDLSANKKLTKLYLNNNKLQELDIRKNVALEEINCSENNISSIDTSQNKHLKSLKSDIANSSTNEETSSISANTWYTFDTAKRAKGQNCEISSVVSAGNGVLQIHYSAVCQDCHTISNRPHIKGIAADIPLSEAYYCSKCGAKTQVRIEVNS